MDSARWTILLVIATFGPPSVAAQSRATTADLVGTVYDQSRAVLPGATVTATNTETNQSRESVAEANGRFVIPALPPGVYRVKAELAGFAPHTEEDVVLQLGTELELQLTLNLATFEQQVAVEALPRMIDRAQTAVASVVSQQQIDSLPINGRNFISFSVITPGVTRDHTPQQGASATSGLTFAGQRARSNNITVDGLDNNDITVGSVRATFSQEAVREFQVVTNSYSAEFGKASGGVVNIVTKSGTNQISGNAFCLLPRRGAQREGLLREVHAGRRPDRSREGAVRPGAVRRHVRRPDPDATGRSSSSRSSVWTSDANNFVTIDDTTPILLFGRADRHGGRHPPRAPVSRSRPATSRTQVESNQLLLKVDHQLTARSACLAPLQLRRWLEREHRAVGRPDGAKPRRARSTARTTCSPRSHTSVLSSRIVNELRFQFARRDQTGQLARSLLRRSMQRRRSRADRRSRFSASPASAATASRRSHASTTATSCSIRSACSAAIISGRPASTSTT